MRTVNLGNGVFFKKKKKEREGPQKFDWRPELLFPLLCQCSQEAAFILLPASSFRTDPVGEWPETCFEGPL